jgi:beta-galactosidase
MFLRFSIAGLLLLWQGTALAQQQVADVPAEIENPRITGINKEPAHTTLMTYNTIEEAARGHRKASSRCLMLNGTWKFNWVSWPQKRPAEFYKPSYDVSGWDDITVPSNWQVQGYGTPFYSNYTYTFQKDYPHVMSTPPVQYTAFKDRNPVGSYRREFMLPQQWSGKRMFLSFEGVDAGFFVWINGKKVGYSVNSRNVAEFDVTDVVKPGKNTLAVEVYQYTVGSYLEDQDMWRLSGIFRNVYLWNAPAVHIRDFVVKTVLDKHYQDATLVVNAMVHNYSKQSQPARTLQVRLYKDEKAVAGVTGQANVPALQPGEEQTVTVSIPVKQPEKWTAETPALYTTILSLDKDPEWLSTPTGFRDVHIEARGLLVNGVPVKLKGVNRHENWPETGHTVSEKQMLQDIFLIKMANCNHVRTCHYSDDPLWYELCDKYGIYVLAEANLECHGAMDEFNDEPTIKDAIIDRNIANVTNFRNHPSVIIWSLGNECGSGGTNFRAALQAIKNIDDRPVHYEGFGIGDKNPADIDSRMYASPADVEKAANDGNLTKPYYLCEYSHAMFNSMGAVDTYNDLFDKYPSLLGGCIWEWEDQGIINRRNKTHPIVAFGGGFGEYPNDHYFIHKGVVFSDRSLKPHFPELKHAYQWIDIKDFNNGQITVRNRYQFTDLKDFQGRWKLLRNGVAVDSGLLEKLSIAPGGEKTVKVNYKQPAADGAEYLLNVSFITSKPNIWVVKGWEVAEQQLAVTPPAVQPSTLAGAPQWSSSNNTINIKVKDWSLVFDTHTGTFTKMAKDGKDVLLPDGGPSLILWRAPHRNDDMWADKEWQKYDLKKLQWKTVGTPVVKDSANALCITVSLTATGKEDFGVQHQITYLVDKAGAMRAYNHVAFSKTDVPLARVGVRLLLDKSLDQFQYYGLGPMENYGDRKSGFQAGVYNSSVYDQLTPYEKPMEAGNHEEIRWAELSTGKQPAIKVRRLSSWLQVSALPYKDEDLEQTEYRVDLPPVNSTVLCVSGFTMGVGSNSCGPRPLPPYLLKSAPADFAYELTLE